MEKVQVIGIWRDSHIVYEIFNRFSGAKLIFIENIGIIGEHFLDAFWDILLITIENIAYGI